MHRIHPLRCILLSVALLGCGWAASAAQVPPIARIGDRAITIEELDEAGGRAVYDAQEQLYEVRVRALYQLLSNELLDREAASRSLTQQQLIEQEVTPTVTPVSEAELDAFLKSQGAKAPTDPRGRKQAQVYLGMKRQADAQRNYVSQLFTKYKVQVALAAPAPPPAEDVRGANEPTLGKVDAPITVIAFSDYRCPYCRDLSHTIDQLLERYPNDVRVVYRHFPLHEESEALSQGALCAADQGAFRAYHAAVFERSASAKDVEPIAAALKLDLNTFRACLAAGTHRDRIAADLQEGQRLGINGTPTLFVAGQRLRGAQSLQQLSSSVQEALRARTVAATDAKARR
jgi:protein-disulfide isomerase